MSDTKDIAALRRRSNNLRTAEQTDAFIDLLLDNLESERQRSDAVCRDIRIQANDLKSAQTVNKVLQATLAELKGKQVPAAWSVGGLLTFNKKHAESRSNEDNLLLEPLYRHPIITGIDENHYDPELEPGLYVAEIITKGGAACINGRFTEPVLRLEDCPVSEEFWEGVDAILRQSKRTYNDNMSLAFSDGKALGYFLCEVLPLRSE